MGESASVTELEPFKVDFNDKRAIWEDAVRCLIPMFGEGGRRIPRDRTSTSRPRNVLPKLRARSRIRRCGPRAHS